MNTEYLVKKRSRHFSFSFAFLGDESKNVNIYFLLRFVLFIFIYCLFLSGQPKIVWNYYEISGVGAGNSLNKTLQALFLSRNTWAYKC